MVKVVDDYQIAKVDEHKAIMIMSVLDFEAIAAFLTTDEMRACDADHGCVEMVYSLLPVAIISYGVI